MSHVFISYKREDKERVVPIAEGLRQAGIPVWIDMEIPGGASWRQTIHEKLDTAGCVLVVWSEASVSPAGDFVQDEASRGKQRGVLLPVSIDPVSPPVGFGETQALNLVGWKGKTQDPRFQDVVAAVQAILAGGPRPRPKAPSRKKRIAALGAGGITVLALLVGIVTDAAGLQTAFCKVPGVRAACAAFGLGGVATQAEKELWESRPARDCQTFREYLDRFPNGAYAQEAQRRLQAATTERRETWTAEERPYILTVRKGLDPFPSKSAAQDDALARAATDARRACEPLDFGEFRLLETQPVVDTWDCVERGTGFVCGFDGQAICQVEVRRVDRIEVCA